MPGAKHGYHLFAVGMKLADTPTSTDAPTNPNSEIIIQWTWHKPEVTNVPINFIQRLSGYPHCTHDGTLFIENSTAECTLVSLWGIEIRGCRRLLLHCRLHENRSRNGETSTRNVTAVTFNWLYSLRTGLWVYLWLRLGLSLSLRLYIQLSLRFHPGLTMSIKFGLRFAVAIEIGSAEKITIEIGFFVGYVPDSVKPISNDVAGRHTQPTANSIKRQSPRCQLDIWLSMSASHTRCHWYSCGCWHDAATAAPLEAVTLRSNFACVLSVTQGRFCVSFLIQRGSLCGLIIWKWSFNEVSLNGQSAWECLLRARLPYSDLS